MDKSWMTMGKTPDGRLSHPYIEGVNAFINSARAVVDLSGNIPCPCIHCVNCYRQSPQIVRIHLLHRGIMQSYINWYNHREPRVLNENIHDNEMSNGDHMDGIDALVDDRIRGEPRNATKDEEVRHFDKLEEDAKRELYPGCTDYSILKFVIEMLNVKVMINLSNKGLDMMLELLTKVLLKGNLVPRSTYEAKKILRDLGMSYEHIDACKNDCALFWKENENLDKCPVCEVPRYKDTRTQDKKIPHKVLRYFPLTPRLRRLYMSGQRAKDMRWYMDKRVDDGIMRHLADSEEWKEFDMQHPDFALKPRNVRLGLATDGFNHFGNMNNNYSMWPVILISYNLPHWLVMKEPYFMLSLLILGSHQLGNDIDIYLKTLVDELKELWEEGVETYDAYSKEHFQMRATLLWTIHDYPGFGNIFGWRTKDYHSCYTCNDQPYSEVLESKIRFINHRAYLPMEHRWRHSRLHNGLPEKRKRFLELQVGKIQEQLDRMPNIILGKHPSNKKRQLIGEPNWSKVSILYKLPYWKNKKFKHNIDVMHVEKNISESTYGTLLGIERKNKDTDKARIDLQNMNFRHTLHLKQRPDGSYDKPRAFFSLSPNERDGFYDFLKSVKYLDGYTANISRSVNAKNSRLSGNFFQDLCSRTLKRSELEKLEERIVLILCKLERFLPPAFFDVMVHLAVHLPRETILGGPVQYRWMYPIERYLGKLKRYVSNRARPEGSIAEAYILKECINNWSLYIDGIETVHNRRERNEDFGESSEGLIVFSQTARPTGGRRNDGDFSRALLDIAHCEYKSTLHNPTREAITQIQRQEFPKWFRERMNRLKVNDSSEATKQLWSLANGPKPYVKEYTVCMVNGVKFHTRDLDNRRVTQNSGCEWYNTGTNGRRRMIQTDAHCTNIDVTSRWGVFDVPEVGGGESNDNTEDSDAFQQEAIVDVVPINVEDNIIEYCMGDVETEIVSEGGTSRDANQNEEHDIPDVDLDMNYDM
ncbi:uncharacterized protein LOC115961691 [Quercus lobata]|uniref:uncharacterized protein LOC115961691 n=1 Tax=Quercus lobata TaxID=97700 RepID=UPI00124614E6|nr:uncharacterized protein LOC115961691 [Quercus lobata]